MCHIFAGQDPKGYAFETHSVRLMGHSTSIRLEALFWEVLKQLSASQGMTMAQFLTQLHEEALEIHGEISNFASLLRCCCLIYLERDFDRAKLQVETRQAH